MYNTVQPMNNEPSTMNLNYKSRIKAPCSAIEVVACLFIAKARKYIIHEIFQKYYNEYEILCKMITKLINSMGPQP